MSRDDFSTSKLLGITPRNFKPIYVPIFSGIGVFISGAIILLITDTVWIFKFLFGLSQVLFSLSGIGMVRLKEVPGFPRLGGISAIVFGIFYLLLFLILGIGIIVLE